MTRKERIAKMKSMSSCVCAIVAATYDMGLQIEILTNKGVIYSFGKAGQWPCFEFDVTEDLLDLQKRIKNEEPITDNELLDNTIIKELCTFHDLVKGDWLLKGVYLKEALESIKDGLIDADLSNKKIYAFAPLSFHCDIWFSPTLENLKSDFFDEMETESRTFDEMDANEIKEWYEYAEGKNWDFFPMHPFFKNSDDESKAKE